MKFLYRIYQLCIALPLGLIATVLTALATIIGCFIGSAHFWGYYPGKLWSVFICRILLLPIKIEGREHIDRHQSYVFVANHQGPMDIFLIYGFLGRNFKWMMKKALRKVPFIGFACEKAHHIFVDKSGPSKIEESINEARHTLKDGMSLVVFPEGTRTYTGKVGRFKKGAFLIADQLQLPVVPLTISGSFQVLPRQKGMFNFVKRHTLKLTIHKPIFPETKGEENIRQTMQSSYEQICSSLEK